MLQTLQRESVSLMITGTHQREMWERGFYLDDYWLNQWGGSGLSDMHLPSVKDFNAMRGMKPTWYFSPLTLKAGATGRIRVTVDPGFHLTMIVCSTSQASLADNGGSAQIQIFAATSIKSKVKNALKGVFSDRPIWNALVGGNAQDPFILQTPYVWERRTPVLVVMQNRATAQNTVNFALHGMRPHS